MTRGLLKSSSLLLLVASIGFAQSFRFGVEGGVPLTSAFDARSTSANGVEPTDYSSSTKRYTVGATAEVGLPLHLAIKADVLYKRLGFDSATYAYGLIVNGQQWRVLEATGATTANSWEIPLLAKYGLRKLGPLQPYVEGGVAFRTLRGITQTSLTFDNPVPLVRTASLLSAASQTASHAAELSHSFTEGIAAGAGLEFRHLLVGVFGEIRYTRWTADAFSAPDGLLNSTRNQADLLVGVTF